MLIGQDEHLDRVKGTAACNLSPSHYFLVVERDDVEKGLTGEQMQR